MRCTAAVYWYDCDLDAECVLAAEHRGVHNDGVRWFTDTGLQRPTELEGRYSPTRQFAGAT